MKLIAIVEDDKDILEILKYTFESEGFKVETYEDGESFLNSLESGIPDLVILDIMLPGIDGFEVCRELKQKEHTRDIPVIMLTAKGDEVDRVVGLELGADDYVVKPFSTRELVARVKAVLRRSRPRGREAESEVLRLGPVVLKKEAHEVYVEGKKVDLTLIEFKFLTLLMENAGRVLTRDFFLNKVLGYGADVYSRTVDVHMANLRKKLGKWCKMIKTIRGVGYKLELSEENE